MGAYTQVVAGYIELGNQLVSEWGAHGTAVAARLDAEDGYDANILVADLAKTAMLTTRTAILVASEAADAVSIFANPPSGSNIVESHEYRPALASAAVSLQGNALYAPGAGPGTASTATALPATVHVVPEAQTGAPAETVFTVRADATGYAIGPYFGKVDAVSDAGSETIDVYVTVLWSP